MRRSRIPMEILCFMFVHLRSPPVLGKNRWGRSLIFFSTGVASSSEVMFLIIYSAFVWTILTYFSIAHLRIILTSLSLDRSLFVPRDYPGHRGFPWFFFAKEIKSKPRSGDNELRKRRGEREKPLVTLASNLTFMQTTAVKRVKLLIKRVTNGHSANSFF